MVCALAERKVHKWVFWKEELVCLCCSGDFVPLGKHWAQHEEGGLCLLHSPDGSYWPAYGGIWESMCCAELCLTQYRRIPAQHTGYRTYRISLKGTSCVVSSVTVPISKYLLTFREGVKEADMYWVKETDMHVVSFPQSMNLGCSQVIRK